MEVNMSFEQILSLVRQLPKKEKIKLTRELEKDVIDSKLSRLLKTFKTSDLDDKTIMEEVESARLEIYENRKR